MVILIYVIILLVINIIFLKIIFLIINKNGKRTIIKWLVFYFFLIGMLENLLLIILILFKMIFMVFLKENSGIYQYFINRLNNDYLYDDDNEISN